MNRSPIDRLGASVRDPAVRVDLTQILKSVIAAVAAWMLAVHVFELAQPFLAPWAALLTVHATVYRSFWRGAQTVLATAIGILVSFLAVLWFGQGALTLGVALLAGMLLSRVAVMRAEGVTVATTALFVLTTGYEQQEAMLLDRLLDTALGVTVGVVVNLAVWPPMHDRTARAQVLAIDTALGELLVEMAADMRTAWDQEKSATWISRTRDVDDDLDRAWGSVRHAREGGHWNPRRSGARRRDDISGFSDVLRRLEDGVAEARSIARTLHESTRSAHEWDPAFTDTWLDLLAETGHRIAAPDTDLSPMRARLHEFVVELSRQNLPGLHWPVYGALITHLTDLVEIFEEVATAAPIRS